MSLFFLSFSILTYWLSHFWAKKNSPQKPTEMALVLCFYGTLQEFETKLTAHLSGQNQFIFQKISPRSYLVEEHPGFFHYGAYYHLEVQSDSDHLAIRIGIQSKLVGSSQKLTKELSSIFNQVDLKDVG